LVVKVAKKWNHQACFLWSMPDIGSLVLVEVQRTISEIVQIKSGAKISQGVHT